MTVSGQGECVGLKERLAVRCKRAAEFVVCLGWKRMLFCVVGNVRDVCGYMGFGGW